jgi:hypothetical protein
VQQWQCTPPLLLCLRLGLRPGQQGQQQGQQQKALALLRVPRMGRVSGAGHAAPVPAGWEMVVDVGRRHRAPRHGRAGGGLRPGLPNRVCSRYHKARGSALTVPMALGYSWLLVISDSCVYLGRAGAEC